MKEVVLIKDQDWEINEGGPYRVINFTPLSGKVENGEAKASDKATPYGSVDVECKKLPQKTTGYICHKIDFLNLWRAFKERGVKENEEVLFFYTRKNYKTIPGLLNHIFPMPRMWVLVCPKGAYEVMTDNSYKPELTGEARWKAEAPIVEWKPEVMK